MSTSTPAAAPVEWVATASCRVRPGEPGGGLHRLLRRTDDGGLVVLLRTGKTREIAPDDDHEVTTSPDTFPLDQWLQGAWERERTREARARLVAAEDHLMAAMAADLVVVVPVNPPPGVAPDDHRARREAADDLVRRGVARIVAEGRTLDTDKGGSKTLALVDAPGMAAPRFSGERIWLFGSPKFGNSVARVLGWKDGTPVVIRVGGGVEIEEVRGIWTHPLNIPRADWLTQQEAEAERRNKAGAIEYSEEILAKVRARLESDGFATPVNPEERAALAFLEKNGEVERHGAAFVRK